MNGATEQGCNTNLSYKNKHFVKPTAKSEQIYLNLKELNKIIELDLSTTHSLAATKIIQYGDKTGKSTIRKANDTLTTIGKWNFKDDLLLFNSNFDELNGKYAVEENNYEYLLVIKVDE